VSVRTKDEETAGSGLESKCLGGGREGFGEGERRLRKERREDVEMKGKQKAPCWLLCAVGCVLGGFHRWTVDWWSVGSLHACLHDLPLTYSGKKKKRKSACVAACQICSWVAHYA